MAKITEPTEVLIAKEQEPVPVTFTDDSQISLPSTVTKGKGTTLAPTTTEAEDLTSEGQRHINVMWEGSQSIISIAITAAVIYCQVNGIVSETLNNAFFFVVATYLQRTNHVRIGGVGPKANEVYRGR